MPSCLTLFSLCHHPPHLPPHHFSSTDREACLLRQRPELLLPLREMPLATVLIERHRVDGRWTPVAQRISERRRPTVTYPGHSLLRHTQLTAEETLSDSSLADTFSEAEEPIVPSDPGVCAVQLWCSLNHVTRDEASASGLWDRQNGWTEVWWYTMPGVPFDRDFLAAYEAQPCSMHTQLHGAPSCAQHAPALWRGVATLAAAHQHTAETTRRLQCVDWDNVVMGTCGYLLNVPQLLALRYHVLSCWREGGTLRDAGKACEWVFDCAEYPLMTQQCLGLKQPLKLAAECTGAFHWTHLAHSAYEHRKLVAAEIEAALNYAVCFSSRDASAWGKWSAEAADSGLPEHSHVTNLFVRWLVVDTLQHVAPEMGAEGAQAGAALLSKAHGSAGYMRRARVWELLCFRVEGGRRIGVPDFADQQRDASPLPYADALQHWQEFDAARTAHTPQHTGPLHTALSRAVCDLDAPTDSTLCGTWHFIDTTVLNCMSGCPATLEEGKCELGMRQDSRLRCKTCKGPMRGSQRSLTCSLVQGGVCVALCGLPYAAGAVSGVLDSTTFEGDVTDAEGQVLHFELHVRAPNVVQLRYRQLSWTGCSTFACTRSTPLVVPEVEEVPDWRSFPLSLKAERLRRLDMYGITTPEDYLTWGPWPMLCPPVLSHETLVAQTPVSCCTLDMPDLTAALSTFLLHVYSKDQKARRFDSDAWDAAAITSHYHQCYCDLLRRRVWETGIVGEVRARQPDAMPPRHPLCVCGRDETAQWSQPGDRDPCMVSEEARQCSLYGSTQGSRCLLAIEASALHPWIRAHTHPADWETCLEPQHWAYAIYQSITADFWGFPLGQSNALTLVVLAAAVASIATPQDASDTKKKKDDANADDAEERFFYQYFYGGQAADVEAHHPRSILHAGDAVTVTQEGADRTLMRAYHDGHVGQPLCTSIAEVPAIYADAHEKPNYTFLTEGPAVVLTCPGSQPGSVADVQQGTVTVSVWPGDCLRA